MPRCLKQNVGAFNLSQFVIQSEAKNLETIRMDVLVYVTEILPPFGRLNDKINNGRPYWPPIIIYKV